MHCPFCLYVLGTLNQIYRYWVAFYQSKPANNLHSNDLGPFWAIRKRQFDGQTPVRAPVNFGAKNNLRNSKSRAFSWIGSAPNMSSSGIPPKSWQPANVSLETT